MQSKSKDGPILQCDNDAILGHYLLCHRRCVRGVISRSQNINELRKIATLRHHRIIINGKEVWAGLNWKIDTVE